MCQMGGKVLSRESTEFIKWRKDNSLDANVSKFQSMLLSTKGKNDMSLTINDVEIQPADHSLKCEKHISYLFAKARHQLNVFQSLKGSLEYSSRLTIYKIFMMSNFNYCPIVWIFSSKKSLTAIENIQKRALRFVLNDYTSSFQELLNDSEMSGILIMTLRLLAIEVYKCVKKFHPEYLNNIFIIKESPYGLRDDSIPVRPNVNTTNYCLKSFRSLNMCSCPVYDLLMK